MSLKVGEVRKLRRSEGDPGGGRGRVPGETSLTGLSCPILAPCAVTCGPVVGGSLACLLSIF